MAKPNTSAEKLRGFSAEQIKIRTMVQKACFISAFCEPDASISSAAKLLGVAPKQIRRWRESDPEFDARVSEVETLARDAVPEYDLDATIQRLVSYIKGKLVEYEEFKTTSAYPAYKAALDDWQGKPAKG